MNKDQVKGRVVRVKGKVKEAAGRAANSDRLKSEGQVDQAAGKVQADVGDGKEKIKRVIDKA